MEVGILEKWRKKKYHKNMSDNNHTLSLNFFRIFSQRNLGVGPKGLILTPSLH